MLLAPLMSLSPSLLTLRANSITDGHTLYLLHLLTKLLFEASEPRASYSTSPP